MAGIAHSTDINISIQVARLIIILGCESVWSVEIQSCYNYKMFATLRYKIEVQYSLVTPCLVKPREYNERNATNL